MEMVQIVAVSSVWTEAGGRLVSASVSLHLAGGQAFHFISFIIIHTGVYTFYETKSLVFSHRR